MLQEEYKQTTKRQLVAVVKSFSEGMDKIGEEPSKELIEAEKVMLEESLKKLGDIASKAFDANYINRVIGDIRNLQIYGVQRG